MSKKVKPTPEQVAATMDNLRDIRQTEVPMPDDGGPLPGEKEPAPAWEADTEELDFQPLPRELDKFQLNFFRFDADGDTITVRFVRLVAPGMIDGIQHAAIECERYPDGFPVLLPGSVQLWDTFAEINEKEPDHASKYVYRVTRVEKKATKKGSFTLYEIRRAEG